MAINAPRINEHSTYTSKKGCVARTLIAISFMAMPGVSLALGGEWLAEVIFKAVVLLFVWIVATIISFFGKRKRFGGPWFLAWAVRLSLPVAVLWAIYVDPVLEKVDERRQVQAHSNDKATFEAVCKDHAPDATRILNTENTQAPKTIYVEEPDELYGPEISQRLVDCIHGNSPICRDLGIEAVEWASLHSRGFGPCKAGTDPMRPDQCLPEFHRTKLGAEGIKVTPIEKPASQYIVRVKQFGHSFKPGEIRRYHVSLESLRSGQVLASTELLMSGVVPPCQNFEAEVASMLRRSFPAR